MKIVSEIKLEDFQPWGGAKTAFNIFLENGDIPYIEEALEECTETEFTETNINDLFWFDEDFLSELLGFENFESYCKNR